MTPSQRTHQLLISLLTSALLAGSVVADEADTNVTPPPSAEEISQNTPQLQIKTKTVYDSSFLPGVRLCEESEVDYRGDFRKVNCQDEELINAVSTRKEDTYNAKPDTIVGDRIEPNGNIFRINFRRKAYVVQQPPEK